MKTLVTAISVITRSPGGAHVPMAIHARMLLRPLVVFVTLLCAPAVHAAIGKTFWSVYVADSGASAAMEIYRYEEIGTFRIYISCFRQRDAGTDQVSVVVPKAFSPNLTGAEIKELELSVPELKEPIILKQKPRLPGLKGTVAMRFVDQSDDVRKLVSIIYAGHKRHYLDVPGATPEQRAAFTQRHAKAKIRGNKDGVGFEVALAFRYTGTYAAYKLAETCGIQPATSAKE